MVPHRFQYTVHMISDQEKLIGVLRILVPRLPHQRMDVFLCLLDILRHMLISKAVGHAGDILTAVKELYHDCNPVFADPIVVGLILLFRLMESFRFCQKPYSLSCLFIHRKLFRLHSAVFTDIMEKTR